MKTLLTTTALIITMATAVTAGQSCTVKTDTSGNQIKNNKCDLFKGATGAKGDTGATGATGATGTKGDKGDTGAKGDKGADGRDGKDGVNGQDGSNGTNGVDGTNGTNGVDGADGSTGATGPRGVDGTNGKDAVAPLGSLSFSAASSSFYGSGVGFGLSDSNYSGLEGSIVLGFDLDNDWRVVVGVTTDFNSRHAASVGAGISW